MNPYRERVWKMLEPHLRSAGPLGKVLDFGCGDGWFASRVRENGLATDLVPLDVKRREQVFVEPQIYDGGKLPFADRHFDLAYTVDVLHHCDDPLMQLDELDRVTARYLLVKDHTFTTAWGRFALSVLDELGNRRFGIPSPYNYQRGWSWRSHLEARGWQQRSLLHPAPCHLGMLGAMTNGLQYVSLFERA